MTRKQILVLALAATCSSALAAQAAPLCMADQSAGLLASPVSQAPAQDPAIRQAMDLIQQARARELKAKPAGDNGTRKHRSHDRMLILGGPEVVPM